MSRHILLIENDKNIFFSFKYGFDFEINQNESFSKKRKSITGN